MLRNGVKVDIVIYNVLILVFCKEGKIKKVVFLVREFDKKNFVLNFLIFFVFILG